MATVEEILASPFETLLVTFFNSTLDRRGNIVVTSNWKTQLGVNLGGTADRKYIETAQELSRKYKITFERKSKVEIAVSIENPSNVTLEKFQEMLYLSIIEAIFL